MQILARFATPAARAALYALGAAVFGVLSAFGLITAESAAEYVDTLDTVLGAVLSVLALLNVQKAPDAEAPAEEYPAPVADPAPEGWEFVSEE